MSRTGGTAHGSRQREEAAGHTPLKGTVSAIDRQRSLALCTLCSAPIASISPDEFTVSSSEPTSPSHACRQTRASKAASEKVASPMLVEEAESSFDAGNKNDLAMVSEYARDIFRYYRLREVLLLHLRFIG